MAVQGAARGEQWATVRGAELEHAARRFCYGRQGARRRPARRLPLFGVPATRSPSSEGRVRCIHTYTYTHTYIHTHAYIHTYMHTYIHLRLICSSDAERCSFFFSAVHCLRRGVRARWQSSATRMYRATGPSLPSSPTTSGERANSAARPCPAVC